VTATEPAEVTGHEDVLFRVERGLGWITLNRPRSINALDHAMVREIDARLEEWQTDPAVVGVVITGAGKRGLCAGGDIVSIYEDARSGGTASVDFWRDEYVLNARIASYPKPYVAIMDGIVMGGGVGVSAHGSLRIVTDRTMMAMPEVGIGFVPDVGGTWLLARAPGELGTHLALTGDRFGAADAIACRLADHYIPADEIPTLLDVLDGASIGIAIQQAARTTPDSPLLAERSWIDECYPSDSATEIVEKLCAHPDPAAQKAAERIVTQSPTAVAVTLRSLREARRATNLRQVLDQELIVSKAALRSHDLVEGIRAQVIDKDRTPHWSPASLDDVSSELIDSYFATSVGSGA